MVPEWRIRYSELLHAGRSGDRVAVAVGISVFPQISSTARWVPCRFPKGKAAGT